MKSLLLVAVLGLTILGFVACDDESNNPTSGSGTAVASATVITPEGTSVKNGACHYQNFEVGAELIYEDANICIAHYTSSDVYQVRIPFVMTIGQYRDKKVVAEQKIRERISDQACRFVWAPAMEVRSDLIHSDLITTGCEEPTVGK